MPKTLDCRGPIVRNGDKWIYDWLEVDAVCPNDIVSVINDAAKANDTVVLRINSPGGYVTEAADIYEYIRSSDVYVEARIVGNCCSAATYIVCAANLATISPLGSYMIHRCSGQACGNANDFEAYLQSLNETDRGIANAYAIKTGKSEQEILDLMNRTTTMSAQSALENGFVDKIMFVDDNTLFNNPIKNMRFEPINSADFLIPDSVLNDFNAHKSDYIKNTENDVRNRLLASTRLELLNLGGKNR